MKTDRPFGKRIHQPRPALSDPIFHSDRLHHRVVGSIYCTQTVLKEEPLAHK